MPVTPFDAAMERALALAGGSGDDVPVGAVVIDATGAVIAEAANAREASGDPTAHAEILAIRTAAERLGTWRLSGCTVVVTLEPCPMCAGALSMARVDRVVFGAWNDAYGAAGSMWDLLRDRRLHHRPEVISGVLADECSALVRGFFGTHRQE